MTMGRRLAGYAGRRVLVTGHTGFKGSWLSLWLATLGAEVTGVSDHTLATPNLFELASVGAVVDDRRADIRDEAAIHALVLETKPDVIFHLAAQPIVREAISRPYETFAVNVLGTAAVLEAARRAPGVRAVVVVTSDKVYADRADAAGYVEADRLGGHEPYGASKAAAEIVASVYRNRAFHLSAGSAGMPAVATARAGNVIGGGDFAPARLVPDIVRAIQGGKDVVLRYPHATRPWQHVLEPLSGYLLLGLALAEGDASAPAAVNFGPDPGQDLSVVRVVETFLKNWGLNATRIIVEEDTSRVEAAALRVVSDFARERLFWTPVWSTDRAIQESAAWYRAWADGAAHLGDLSRKMIDTFARDAAGLGLPWAQFER